MSKASLSILLVCDSLPGALTSTAAMVDALQREFGALGHDVRVAGMGSEPVARGRSLSVHLGALKSPRLVVRALAETTGALMLAGKLLWARAIGRLPRPDVVIVFTPSLFLALPAVWVKRTSRARLYVVQRDIVPDWMIASGRLNPGPAASLLFALKRWLLRHADHVGIECEQNRQFFSQAHQHKISVLHNWRDFGRDVHLASAASDRVTFVYGGRVGQVQGFDRFIRAFAHVAHPNADLQVFCDARGKAEIDAMQLAEGVLQHVRLMPMQPEHEFLATASRAWFGVVTLSPEMRTHNIPGKLLAYLAAGIPVFVIGPHDAALKDAVEGLGIGSYADAADAEQVVQRLRALIDAPWLRTGDRREVLQARNAFSTEAAAQAILAALRLSPVPHKALSNTTTAA